mgnify:FL=1
MLQNSRGFVFHVARYSESSAIVKVFTEEWGMESYVIKSLYSRNARIKPALFGHLSLLTLVVDRKPGRSLNYIRDAVIPKTFYNITDSMLRSSILLFMNEVLYKSVKEEEANSTLFDFIEHSLDSLNSSEVEVNGFPLLFLIRLSEILGFGPVLSLAGNEEHFDMLTGQSVVRDPGHSYSVSGTSLLLLRNLSLIDYADLHTCIASRNVRLDLLNRLADFLSIHIPEMSRLKSIKVLHEILG